MEIKGTKSLSGIHKSATEKVVDEAVAMLCEKDINAGKLLAQGSSSRFSVRQGERQIYCLVAVHNGAFRAYIKDGPVSTTVKFKSHDSVVHVAMAINNKIEREYLE